MGITDLFRLKRPVVDRKNFPFIVEKIGLELESIREEFVFGGLSGLKSEGVQINGISRILEAGSELDSALKALQLTSVVGFAWKNYILLTDALDFDQKLTSNLDCGDSTEIKKYRERYLDCQGDIDCLASCLADDVHKIWGSPEPESRIKRGLRRAAVPLMIISQAATARRCGDTRTEKKLKSKLRIG